MMLWKRSIPRLALTGLVIFSFLSTAVHAQEQAPSHPAQSISKTDVAPAAQESSSFPDSPGAVVAQISYAQNEPVATPAEQQSATSSSQAGQKPVGTAVAEPPNASGITASQPAGVAIAPAKQHRVRTIVLRTGAILGAGVAIGTIAALSEATPSKPPGAH